MAAPKNKSSPHGGSFGITSKRLRAALFGIVPIASGLRFFADSPLTITDSSGATVYREPNVINIFKNMAALSK